MPSYLQENLDNVISHIKKANRRRLCIWDLDDTLFKTHPNKMKIVVIDKKTNQPLKRNGKTVTMNSHEFADKETRERIIGQDGVLKEPDSYKAFRDAEIFYNHAKPITKNLQLAIEDFEEPNTFFMILTARANMELNGSITAGRDLFNKKLLEHGLNMNMPKDFKTSHVVRTASVTELPGGHGKKYVIISILNENPHIDFVSLWDDSSDNIEKFKTIKNEFRGRRITFEAHHVKK